MNGIAFGQKNLNNTLANAIFLDLSQKIIQVSREMVKNLESKEEKIKNNENKIRNHLIQRYLNNPKYRKKYGLLEYLFESGSEEIGKGNDKNKYGLLDIKIIIKQMSFENPEAYFIIECKRLDGGYSLNNEYIKNGIRRFVSDAAYYSTFSNKNYMMGFIIKDVYMSDLISKINKGQEKIEDINILKKLYATDLEELYRSKYLYKGQEKMIDHIFIDLSKVIIEEL